MSPNSEQQYLSDMNNANHIWLASYPRSGNTFLRTILRQCFGLMSCSVYPDDLGGNKRLEDYVGHIEHGSDGKIHFPENGLRLLKTHEYVEDDNPSIYIIRDGRAASVSLWEFYNRSLSLDQIIEGKHRFGTWSQHVRLWAPWNRPNTLLLRYEDVRSDLPDTLERISAFLGSKILARRIPDRGDIAGVDGRWVRNKSDWRSELSAQQLEKFNQINEDMLAKYGYLD